MTLTFRTSVAVVVPLLLLGCSGNDPGVGSKTLFTQASLETDGTSDGTRLTVDLRESGSTGAVVTDAVVFLKSQTGTDLLVPLVYKGNGVALMPTYELRGFAWDQGFVLSVRRGKVDTLDAALDMPGTTEVLEPAAGSTFVRSMGRKLLVRWKDGYNRPAQYPEVKLDQADLKQALTNDTFQFEIDPSALLGTDDERLTVTRTNRVTLAGGLPGSEWTSTTHQRIEFKVQ